MFYSFSLRINKENEIRHPTIARNRRNTKRFMEQVSEFMYYERQKYNDQDTHTFRRKQKPDVYGIRDV